MKDPEFTPEYAPTLLGKVGLSPHDDEAVKAYPVLMSLLLPRHNATKRLTREAGGLTVKIDGSVYRISVTCPTEGLQCVLVTDSLIDLLGQLELALAGPSVAWTPTYDSKKRSRRDLDKSL